MSASAQFEVYVRTLTGKTLPLRVAGSDTVLDLKRKLHDKTGLPPDSQVCSIYTSIFSPSQRVLFSGKQLDDSRTLDSYGIAKEATLFLVVNVKTERKEQEEETNVKEEKKEPESVWQVDAGNTLHSI
jgi:large subunit ribosomal protein L40e